MNIDSTKYLALGDSYTIGEGVPEDLRWPVQLVNELNKDGFDIQRPEIIASTGWTTDELLKGIKDANISKQKYDYVSLLIGVNNQYRGYGIDIFQKEFGDLLDISIDFANNIKGNVFVLSIPDWGLTEFASNNGIDRANTSEEIDRYNIIVNQTANKFGVKFFDITSISRKWSEDSSFMAEDGLHPSGKMYSLWILKIIEWLRQNK